MYVLFVVLFIVYLHYKTSIYTCIDNSNIGLLNAELFSQLYGKYVVQYLRYEEFYNWLKVEVRWSACIAIENARY